MSDVPIYLAFPDRLLTYECSSCDQRCCKTGGLPVFPAERERLVRMHPALDLVSPASASGIQIFATPPSACWFLDADDCRLSDSEDHHQNTRHTSPRPSACTLFPFNLFGVVGETLVVAPNGLCPLWVEPGAGVAHDDILGQLGQLGAAGLPPTTLRAEGDEMLALEVTIRDAAAASVAEPSPVPLIAFSQAATDAYLRGALDSLDLADLPQRIESLYTRLEETAAVIGLPPPSPEELAAIAPPLAAWTATLRLFAFGDLDLGDVPRAQLSLAIYLAHWQSMRPERGLLPHTLMQQVSSLGETLRLLAQPQLPSLPGELDAIAHTRRLRELAG